MWPFRGLEDEYLRDRSITGPALSPLKSSLVDQTAKATEDSLVNF